jgi:uncharacterized protein (UPF0335 family)
MTITAETTANKPVITAVELYKKLCAVHAEIATLDADVKDLLAEGKDADLDVSFINTVAKANSKGKVSSLEEKAQKTIDMIEELTS